MVIELLMCTLGLLVDEIVRALCFERSLRVSISGATYGHNKFKVTVINLVLLTSDNKYLLFCHNVFAL